MAVSILHRVSGDGMALVGLPVLLWWLGALAAGPEAYATFTAVASSWIGIVVLVGLTWAFFNHKDKVPKINKNGRPAEKPKKNSVRTRG